MQNVRLYEMPDCKMVSSGVGIFGDEKFLKFDEWFQKQKPGLYPKDFMYWEGSGLVWLYMYEEGMEVPEGLEIIDFKGGFYAVTTDSDVEPDKGARDVEVAKFMVEHGLEPDGERPELASVVSSPLVELVLKYNQMDYFTPVKVKQDGENEEEAADVEIEE